MKKYEIIILVIISIIVIISIGMIIYIFSGNNKTRCSVGEKYNATSKRCQPICTSDKTYYDKNSNTCLECPPGQQKDADGKCTACKVGSSTCGDKCYDPSSSKCLAGNTVCSKDKVYNKDGSEKCCATGTTPFPPVSEDQHCVSCDTAICPDGQCCKKGQKCCGLNCCDAEQSCIDGLCKNKCGSVYCNKLQSCCDDKCCDIGQMCCDNKLCCDKGQECCGDTCCEEGQECCGNVCCDDGQTCVNGSCCPIADKCLDPTTNKQICCSGDDMECDSGVCKIKCGTKYCDINTQECQSVKTQDGNITYACSDKNSKCQTDTVAYDPELVQNNKTIIKDGKPVPFCEVIDTDKTSKFYTVKNVPGVSGKYNRSSFYDLSGTGCTEGDCFKTLSAKGEIFKQYTADIPHKCYSVYDCDTLLPDYNTAEPGTLCPINDESGKPSARCCPTKADKTKYTGQVCPEHSVCDENGNCVYGYVFDKSVNPKDCISVTDKNKGSYDKFSTDLTGCRNGNVSQMISCPSTKTAVWKYDIPFCWNNRLPTVCWGNTEWSRGNNPYKDDKNIMNVLTAFPEKHGGVYGTGCSTGKGWCNDGDKKVQREHADCVWPLSSATTMCLSDPNVMENKLNVIYDDKCQA